MVNLEEVIKGLQEAVDWLSTETSLTVVDQWVVRDALALLKAQEPVEPIYGEDNYIRCGKCKHHIVGIIAQGTNNAIPIQKYCGKCGQEVKWE